MAQESEAALGELPGVAFTLEIMAPVRFLSFLFVMPFVLVSASLDRIHASGAELSQASEPITVQVNYDVPTFGKIAESNMLRQAAAMEANMAQSHSALARLLKRGGLRGKMQHEA